MTTDKLMLTGEAARTLGVSVRYVTELTERGILPLAGKTENGWRAYRASDVRRLATERKTRRRRQPDGAPTAA